MGWFRVEQDAHERRVVFIRGLGVPLDPDTARDDLRVHQDRRLGPQATPFPSVRDLAARWGWTKSRVDRLFVYAEEWSDPSKLEAWRSLYPRRATVGQQRDSSGTAAGQQRDKTTPVNADDIESAGQQRDSSGTAAGQQRDSTLGDAASEPLFQGPSPSPSPSQEAGVSPRARDPEGIALEIIRGTCQSLQNVVRPDLGMMLSERDWSRIRFVAKNLAWTADDFTLYHEYLHNSEEQRAFWVEGGKNRWSSMLAVVDEVQNRMRAAKAWLERNRVDAVATGPPRGRAPPAEPQSLISQLEQDFRDGLYD